MADSEKQEMIFEHRGRRFTVPYMYRRGKPGGETLFYFHGLGSPKEDFLGAWQVEEWRGHSLVAFDAPGCGASKCYHDEIPLAMDDLAETAEGLVAHLELDDLTVIGHSMGGLVGLLFTLRNQTRVRRLVSVEGNLTPEDCSIYSRRVYQRRYLGCEQEYLDQLEKELRMSGLASFEYFSKVFREYVAERAFFDYCRSIVDYADNCSLLDDFTALDMPRLYVHGSENGHLGHIPHLDRAGVPVREIPGSNHFPAYANPETYYRVLADFIRQSPAGRSTRTSAVGL